MIFRFSICLLPMLFLLDSALANAFPLTVHELCESIHSKVEESSRDEGKHEFGLRTKLQVMLFPQKYIGVSSNNVKMKKYSETIIFTMRPDIDLIPDNSTIKKNEKQNYQDSKPIQKMIRKLVNTKGKNECLVKAQQLKMQDDHLLEYAEILQISSHHQELFMANHFQSFAEKSADEFENSQVIGVSNTDEILQVISQLRNKDYNFVFILHADSTGRLSDYDHFIVEDNFFRNLIGKASSISVFSCFPEQVSNYYARSLKELESADISVFQPVLKRDFQIINSTPLGLLEEFSRQVQTQLK